MSPALVPALASPGDYVKKLQVQWPRFDKKNPVTKTGNTATLAIALTGSSLHTAGFDVDAAATSP
ncbi:MAG: hypothetical protein ABSE73_31860 [Planctomycetota bacterium]